MTADERPKVDKASLIQTQREAQGLPELLAISRLIVPLFDLIFPPRCAGCGRVDSHWCARCAADVAKLPAIIQLGLPHPITASATTASHTGKLRRAIRALKYENAIPIGSVLAERLANTLRETNWMIDTIVPVPLFTQRQRERGYNQTYIIAAALSTLTGIPYTTRAVTRSRNTRSQVGLSREERRMNVQDAFQADPTHLLDHNVLIIDDVCTTGATLVSCANAIRAAGAREIYALTVTAARLSPARFT
jgi:ComF family protein